jgi:hypothetical protein
MQTNILDWLEATSARCPDAPAVGDDQTDCTWAQLADTGSFSFSPSGKAITAEITPEDLRAKLG